MKKALYLAIGIAVVALSLVGYGLVFAQSYGAPTVWTNSASNVTDNSAILNGQINPNGNNTTYYFEYGTSNYLGSRTSNDTMNGNNYGTNVTYTLSNLNSNTTYYYRLVAYNNYGTINGNILSFSTNNYYYNNNNYYNNNYNSSSVTTNSAKNITGSSAVLWGYAQTNNYTQSAWFEYGTNSNNLTMTSQTVTIQNSDYYRNSSLNSDFWVTVNNLNPNQTYYYRAVIRNNNNTYYGQVMNFMTTSSYYNYNYQYQDPYYYTNYQYQTVPQETIKYVYVNGTDYGNNTAYNATIPAYTYGTTYTNGQYTYNPYMGYVNPNAYYTNSATPLQASVFGTTTGTSLVAIGLILLVILVGTMIVVSVRRG